jgi:hypothetical protein
MHKKAFFGVILVLLLSVALSSAASAANSLIGWWKFDENSGTVAQDSSGLGNDGTFGPEGNPTWVAGIKGGAIELDGDDDYINISAIVDDFPQNNNFSVSAWIKTTMTGDGNVIGANDTGSGHDFIWGISTSGTLLVEADSVREYPPVINDGVWHMITYVRNGNTAYSYTDGVLVGTETPSGNPAGQARWSVGQEWDSTPSDEYQGLVDDLRFYSRPLGASQVAELFQGIDPTFLKASEPSPADGEVGVFMPLLSWTKGDEAFFHNVYLGKTPELTEADLVSSNMPVTMYYHVAGLEPGATYYWRVDEADIAGKVTTGSVWSFVAQDVKAYYPTPVDGSVDVSLAPALTWYPGQAAMKHHLYLGTSLDDVTNGAADTDKGELDDATFALTGLDSVATYYWRVDELAAGGAVQTGPVWSFTTSLPVDDFESYTDDEGSRIYETWVDGWTNNTGSTVGNTTAPFAEQTIVHSGIQSMPMDYNNVNSPFYSEAYQEFSPTRDWTGNELADLRLDFRGGNTNGDGALYVVVEDSSNKSALAVNDDDAAVKATTWTTWKVPLSSLTGVNLAKVKRLYIGVGDRANPVAGGAGRIYIDDIRVTKP